MNKSPRFSPQRDLVKHIVTRQKGHLSADSIYSKAREVHPKISRATVYRNLQQLEEMEAISAMQGPSNVTFYEPFSEPHHHFVCRRCQKIQNLDTPNVNICTGCITQKTSLQIDHIVTTLFGVCGKCTSN